MLYKYIKNITTEKQFDKLREIKYKLYCLSKRWNLKKNKSTYIITTKQKKIISNKNNLYVIKFMNEINELFPNQKEIDFTKKYIDLKINGYEIKTDVLAITELNDAIKKYNLFTKLKKNAVILDVGAYHGIYSFYALNKIGPNGLIYAFEPDPNNYEILLKNIQKNKIKNIIPIKKALFNKTGIQKFVISSSSSSIYQNKHGFNGDKIHNKEIINIPTISFFDFIKQNKINKIDFVKMDCEGSEIEICDEYLNKIHPKIKTNFAIASYHYRFDYNSKTLKIIEQQFKNKNDYKIITTNKKHLTTYIVTK